MPFDMSSSVCEKSRDVREKHCVPVELEWNDSSEGDEDEELSATSYSTDKMTPSSALTANDERDAASDELLSNCMNALTFKIGEENDEGDPVPDNLPPISCLTSEAPQCDAVACDVCSNKSELTGRGLGGVELPTKVPHDYDLSESQQQYRDSPTYKATYHCGKYQRIHEQPPALDQSRVWVQPQVPMFSGRETFQRNDPPYGHRLNHSPLHGACFPADARASAREVLVTSMPSPSSTCKYNYSSVHDLPVYNVQNLPTMINAISNPSLGQLPDLGPNLDADLNPYSYDGTVHKRPVVCAIPQTNQPIGSVQTMRSIITGQSNYRAPVGYFSNASLCAGTLSLPTEVPASDNSYRCAAYGELQPTQQSSTYSPNGFSVSMSTVNGPRAVIDSRNIGIQPSLSLVRLVDPFPSPNMQYCSCSTVCSCQTGQANIIHNPNRNILQYNSQNGGVSYPHQYHQNNTISVQPSSFIGQTASPSLPSTVVLMPSDDFLTVPIQVSTPNIASLMTSTDPMSGLDNHDYVTTALNGQQGFASVSCPVDLMRVPAQAVHQNSVLDANECDAILSSLPPSLDADMLKSNLGFIQTTSDINVTDSSVNNVPIQPSTLLDTNYRGDTKLHQAIIDSDDRYVLELLQQYQEHGLIDKVINKCNDLKQTPLVLAVVMNKPDIVQRLLTCGADVTVQIRSYVSGRVEYDQPLHVAASRGNAWISTLRHLLLHTPDVNTFNSKGRSPLHCAIFNHGKVTDKIGMVDSTHVVRELVERGADPSLPDGPCDKTPLHYAIEVFNVELVKLLLDLCAGGVVSIPSQERSRNNFSNGKQMKIPTTSSDLVKHMLNVRNGTGNAALHMAVTLTDNRSDEKFKLIQLFLNRGADPSARNAEGLLPREMTSDTKIIDLLRGQGKRQKAPINGYCG